MINHRKLKVLTKVSDVSKYLIVQATKIMVKCTIIIFKYLFQGRGIRLTLSGQY